VYSINGKYQFFRKCLPQLYLHYLHHRDNKRASSGHETFNLMTIYDLSQSSQTESSATAFAVVVDQQHIKIPSIFFPSIFFEHNVPSLQTSSANIKEQEVTKKLWINYKYQKLKKMKEF